MGYYKLDEGKAMAYVKEQGFFPQEAKLQAKEIGDGNLNLVFKIQDAESGKSVIIKQALPYAKIVGESWPLSVGRTKIEADALEVQNRLAAGLVPKLLHRDDELALFIMEDLSYLEVMRQGTIKMKKYPLFAEHISTFLANLLFYTSDLYMDSKDKKELVKRFTNPDLCQLTEELIFTEPYYDAERNVINPALKPYLEKVFWKKSNLFLEACILKYKFLTEAQSLIHGDLHTGSIFVGENETKVFDTEFAFVGPSAFDPGLLIGNIFINYVSWSGKDEKPEKIKDYRQYLLTTVNELYTLFEKKFIDNWDKDARDIRARVPGYKEHYMRNMFVDTIGYACMAMIRRMHGLAHNIDVDGIEDLERRRDVQILVLELAEELLLSRNKFANINEVTGLVKDRLF
ncbi:MAG TPA: S-methyl-5-thioribose kinase [Clostridia bacterium]|nr:S-methyl-5-thioribose kinase [Clostridia bacterium]